MRLLTANLFSGRASIGSFERLLDVERPDLIVCEEVGEDMAPMLARRFEYGVVWGDDRCHSGRALLSHTPIDVREIPLVQRPALYALMDVEGAMLHVIGVHLANPIDFKGAIRARRAQVSGLLEFLNGVDGPAIVAGDFNATPIWPTYRRLRTRLDDGIMAASEVSRRTWAPRPGWPPLLRIDHVFTSGIRLSQVSVQPVPGSDHWAVAATMSLEER